MLLTALPSEQERLSEIQEELRRGYTIRAEVVPIDLSERTGPQKLQDAADALGFQPDLLVNSAGIGAGGPFVAATLEEQMRMIQVNVEALVALCGLYLPRMVERSDGAIINLASTSAFEPIPYMAVYAASKAFVLRFSEALWAENHRAGVRVVALCPGSVATPLQQSFGADAPKSRVQRQATRRFLAVDEVVAIGLSGLERDRPTVIKRLPGLSILYYVGTAVGAFLPRKRWLILSERIVRWYGDGGPKR